MIGLKKPQFLFGRIVWNSPLISPPCCIEKGSSKPRNLWKLENLGKSEDRTTAIAPLVLLL